MGGNVKPYYDDGAGIVIYHGDCRDVLPLLADDSADLVLTDPPYSAACHQGARTMRLGDMPLVDFACIDHDGIREAITACRRIVRRWFIATMDWRHIVEIERAPIDGWRFIRFGVWVKPNGAPQFTGDRPGQGWEGIVFMHKDGGRMRWNGGGRSSVFIHNKVNAVHSTSKPEALIRELIVLFSDLGESVLDPYMGSGTTLRAAKDLGRKAVGIEIEERYCEIAAKRLQQLVLPLEAPVGFARVKAADRCRWEGGA